MKNIHLLPTEKPSKLSFVNKNYCLSTLPHHNWSEFQNHHIYITSDEEPENKDYYWDENKNKIKRYFERRESSPSLLHRFKIILTTDQNLIADGVQAIPDEFLEWFIKNPTCEYVQVINGLFSPMGRQVDPMELGQNHSSCVWKYKIIIPQEEPKCTCEEHDPYCCQIHGICPTCVKKEDNPFKLPKALPDDVFYQSIEQKQKTLKEEETKQDKYTLQDFINGIFWNKSKQETLEQAADNWVRKPLIGARRDSFIAGAKWQAEKMLEIMDSYANDVMGGCTLRAKDWFEQFNNKTN
jgi:hypothetical protein